MLINSSLGGGSSPAPRDAVVYVAASNATADEIANADYTCDGTADEVQINLAIADLPTDGGIVQLSTGLFVIAAAITMSSRPGVILQGHGGAGYVGSATTTSPTTIRRTGGVAVAIITTASSPGTQIRGIRFNLATGQTASSLMLNLGIGTLVEDCYIDGVNNAFSNAQQGIGFLNASGTVRNCRLLCTDSCIRVRGTTSGIDGMDFLIENCIMRSTDNTTRGAIEIDGLLGGMPDPTTRTKIRIVRVRHDGSGAWRFINAKEMAGIDIVDCKLYDFEESAIQMLNCSDVRIMGNHLSGDVAGTESAINVDGCTFVKVQGNRIDYCGREAIRFNDTDDSSCIGNDVIGAGQATDDTYAAIMLDGNTNRCLVTGNLVRYAGSNHSKYGVRVDDSTCDDNTVIDNDLYLSGDTAELSDAGTNTVTSLEKVQLSGWFQDNVAASQTAVVLLYDATHSERPTTRAGSVTGIVVYSNEARTNGTLTVDVTINGTVTGLTAVLDGTNTTTKASTQKVGLDKFTAGQRIGVKLTTSGTWTPTTADIQVEVEIAYDQVGNRTV